MIDRQIPLDKVAPWLVSGASSLYVVARARRLSMARPNRAPLTNFLMDQSDMILVLLGGPMFWHLSRSLFRSRVRRNRRYVAEGRKLTQGPLYQLRQVFTALLIGTGLLVRKASEGKTTEILALAQRLHKITREGTAALARLDELSPAGLIDPKLPLYSATPKHNGWDL